MVVFLGKAEILHQSVSNNSSIKQKLKGLLSVNFLIPFKICNMVRKAPYGTYPLALDSPSLPPCLAPAWLSFLPHTSTPSRCSSLSPRAPRLTRSHKEVVTENGNLDRVMRCPSTCRTSAIMALPFLRVVISTAGHFPLLDSKPLRAGTVFSACYFPGVWHSVGNRVLSTRG